MDKNHSGQTMEVAVNKKKVILFFCLAVMLELLNLITSRKLLSKASVQDDGLKYLLCARSSVYDDVMENYPIYKNLKDIAEVPVAYVFRIKSGGDGYLQEAKKNAGILPGLYK